MKRVAYEEMDAQFTRVLEKHGFTPADAKDAAVIFAQNSLSGVYSHGLNRFPRVVSYLEKGEIDPLARAECISRMGSMERWDGHRGFGPLNAQRAMERYSNFVERWIPLEEGYFTNYSIEENAEMMVVTD